MRNSPFCTTHDEKTTYSGQRWCLRPLMWGYICNGCVEKRENKGAGSFHIHRKTMKDLWILAVLGVWEQPNLASNLVTNRH